MTWLQLAVYFGIAVGGAVVAGAVALALRYIRSSGGEAERLAQREKELTILRKQADIVAEARDDEDVAKRLDNGSF